MDERLYKLLMRIAIVLTIAWVGWSLYDSGLFDGTSEGRQLAAAGKQLEDGQFEQALGAFREVFAKDPTNLGALRGVAQTLMQMGAQETIEAHRLRQAGHLREGELADQAAQARYREALNAYDESIGKEQARGIDQERRTIQGVAYANRGILKDRMGDSPGALTDYEQAMALEPEVGDGPGFLTRFMRNQAEKPPTVADRARYLRQQLALPPSERLLTLPEKDAEQRSHKMD
jgi:tetratricopeptide (TPR) repeat protein